MSSTEPTTTELETTTPRKMVRMGLAPTTLEEGWRLAQMFAKSELIPKNYRNKPEDVMVAVQMGVEIGFMPMQALQSIAVINGRPQVWGDGFLALLMSSPQYQDHDEYYEVDGQRRDGLVAEDLKKDTTAAVCTFVRRGKATPVTRRFTIAQAKKAGLLGKEGPWQTYPDRMLRWRALEFAGRDTFPDVLRGIRLAQAVQDEPESPSPAIVSAPRVQRISETKSVTLPAVGDVSPVSEQLHGTVKAVEALLGGHVFTLSGGQVVIAEDARDAGELAKFVGTDHELAFDCLRGDDGRLYVKTFAIVD